MWNQPCCFGLLGSYGSAEKPFPLTPEEEISLVADAGFEGFFTGWSGSERLGLYRRLANERGLLYQSVHAPFTKIRALWHSGAEEAEAALGEQMKCLEDCAAVSVPIMVAHVFIGFEDHAPNERGIAYFDRLAKRARELGVRLALENTEGEEYLEAVMRALAPAYPDTVGFCWDTGHEMCYNRGADMPGRFPGKLIATHINDNLGVRDLSGGITWHDDLHLLPFDGVGDWEDVARRLADFDGPLTFELTTRSKPGRHDNDLYAKLSPAEFVAQAYQRACRVAALVQRARKA